MQISFRNEMTPHIIKTLLLTVCTMTFWGCCYTSQLGELGVTYKEVENPQVNSGDKGKSLHPKTIVRERSFIGIIGEIILFPFALISDIIVAPIYCSDKGKVT